MNPCRVSFKNHFAVWFLGSNRRKSLSPLFGVFKELVQSVTLSPWFFLNNKAAGDGGNWADLKSDTFGLKPIFCHQLCDLRHWNSTSVVIVPVCKSELRIKRDNYMETFCNLWITEQMLVTVMLFVGSDWCSLCIKEPATSPVPGLGCFPELLD